MSREFKLANCWKGRKLRLKMYKNLQNSAKNKIGPLSHFIGKNKRKKDFSKS